MQPTPMLRSLLSLTYVQERLENTTKSLFKLLKPVSLDEMWVYIAVILSLGIIKKPQYSLYWVKKTFVQHTNISTSDAT